MNEDTKNASENVVYKIGEVAKRTGLSTKTIRYYESIGLLAAPTRAQNGYRTYQPATVDKLRFVHRARDLGFSLDDVRLLLGLWADEKRASGEVKALAQKHITKVEEKIAGLVGLRDTLQHLISACHGDERPDCPILDELVRHNSGGPKRPAAETKG